MTSKAEGPLVFSRQQFYELVWTKPATALSKELGISDVMIGKLCKAYEIPKPYPGYWAQMRVGDTPPKSELPISKDPDLQTIQIYKQPANPAEDLLESSAFDPDVQRIWEKAQSLPAIVVSETLQRPHRLVVAARERLQGLSRPVSALTSASDFRGAPEIHVSKHLRIRALCILDALFKALESIGAEFVFPERDWGKRHFLIRIAGEETTGLRLREKSKQTYPKPDPDRSWGPKMVLEPTGLLLLDGGSSYERFPYPKDIPNRRRLEDGLNEFILCLVKEAARWRKVRVGRETDAQRAKDAAIRRQHLLKRQEAERERVAELLATAESWQKSQVLRNFLAVVESGARNLKGLTPEEGSLRDFLKWARDQADRLDPLVQSPPSVLDEKVEPEFPRGF